MVFFFLFLVAKCWQFPTRLFFLSPQSPAQQQPNANFIGSGSPTHFLMLNFQAPCFPINYLLETWPGAVSWERRLAAPCTVGRSTPFLWPGEPCSLTRMAGRSLCWSRPLWNFQDSEVGTRAASESRPHPVCDSSHPLGELPLEATCPLSWCGNVLLSAASEASREQ